jgi:hypothetical protein
MAVKKKVPKVPVKASEEGPTEASEESPRGETPRIPSKRWGLR